MKHILLIILVACSVLAMSGCKQEDAVEQPDTITQEDETSYAEDVKSNDEAASENSAPANGKSSDLVTTDSGLKYQDLRVGTGPSPKAGEKVVVHYTGWLTNGKKFDSSLDRQQPFTFPLGVGMVIKGWDEGVATMKVGGKRKLIIPSELAYGDRGQGADIPPGSTLVFEVELLGIKSQ